jgi:aryl-alcohol dehydrogenase-like predicted oxidoreductase
VETRLLASTGIPVSRVSLGTSNFGYFNNSDADECIDIVRHALDTGVNVVDTANVYSWGESEEIVGQAIRGRRDEVILSTKFYAPARPDARDVGAPGNSRLNIIRSCEASLKRLGTDYIDIYLAHQPDLSCDISETLGALTDLVRQGKVRYIGGSKYTAAEHVESQWVSATRGYERFLYEQSPYSILMRDIERDLVATCERYRIALFTWAPLDGGWLSGRYDSSSRRGPSKGQVDARRFDPGTGENQRKLAVVDQLKTVAERYGLSMMELALGFVLANPAVTSVLVGPRSVEQLNGQLAAAACRLTDEVLAAIDEISPPAVDLIRQTYLTTSVRSLGHQEPKQSPSIPATPSAWASSASGPPMAPPG